jgi:hypothetical protein
VKGLNPNIKQGIKVSSEEGRGSNFSFIIENLDENFKIEKLIKEIEFEQ